MLLAGRTFLIQFWSFLLIFLSCAFSTFCKVQQAALKKNIMANICWLFLFNFSIIHVTRTWWQHQTHTDLLRSPLHIQGSWPNSCLLSFLPSFFLASFFFLILSMPAFFPSFFLHAFLLSFFPSFVLSFFRSFVLSFFRSFVLSFFPSFVLSFFPSFLLSFFPSFLLSFFPSFFLFFFPCFLISFLFLIDWSPWILHRLSHTTSKFCLRAVSEVPSYFFPCKTHVL